MFWFSISLRLNAQSDLDALLQSTGGAKSIANGGAQTALSNDLHASIWNPAGLGRLKEAQTAAAMYGNHLGNNFSQWSLNTALVIDSVSAIGLGWSRIATAGGIDSRFLFPGSEPIFANINTYTSQHQMVYAAFGRRLQAVPGLSIGATWRMHYGETARFANHMGFGLDAGVQYLLGNWQFGAKIQGLFGDYKHQSYNTSQLAETFAQTNSRIFENKLETFSPNVVLGAANSLTISKNFNLIPAIDILINTNKQNMGLINAGSISFAPRAGLSAELFNKFQLSAGISRLTREPLALVENTKWSATPHAGCGLKVKNMGIHYAWMRNILGQDAFSSHFFTFTFAY
jgi:hypothetical protein